MVVEQHEQSCAVQSRGQTGIKQDSRQHLTLRLLCTTPASRRVQLHLLSARPPFVLAGRWPAP